MKNVRMKREKKNVERNSIMYVKKQNLSQPTRLLPVAMGFLKLHQSVHMLPVHMEVDLKEKSQKMISLSIGIFKILLKQLYKFKTLLKTPQKIFFYLIWFDDFLVKQKQRSSRGRRKFKKTHLLSSLGTVEKGKSLEKN